MSWLLLALVVAVGALLVSHRASLLRRELPQHHHEPFDGLLYRVGEATVAERRSESPRATVLCMHGFVEDLRYFTRYYRDPDLQLIVVTGGDYHVAVRDPVFAAAAWVRAPTSRPASIAYDAEVLVQALANLPRTKVVRVHGHSRGGAVVLEAASMRPDLFADVEVLLEAPVLPKGRLFSALSPVALWLYPFFIGVWRKEPLHRRFAQGYGALTDARKRELLSGMPFNPRHISTLVANVHDLNAWMATRDASVFQHVRRGWILIASDDRVLSAEAMRESALGAGPALETLNVEGASHFILLDRPDVIPPL